jgi:hypothetical protein
MKHYPVAGRPAAMMVGGLMIAAPPASAGCQYAGGVVSKCDDAVQPDGTWQRCVTVRTSDGNSSHQHKSCQLMGPDQHPLGLAYYDPPTHIDD